MHLSEGILRCLQLQDVAAKERESEGRDPHIAQRLQKKVTKRVQFLENVASSKRQASLAVQGGLKKKRKKDRVGKRLGDLSQLADSLREAAQLVSHAPSLLNADHLVRMSFRCLCSHCILSQDCCQIMHVVQALTCTAEECALSSDHMGGHKVMRYLALQDEGKAALRSPKRLKGLGVGGTRKRLRIVEHESKRLQQVSLHMITP